jgi:hypothetical protein
MAAGRDAVTIRNGVLPEKNPRRALHLFAGCRVPF